MNNLETFLNHNAYEMRVLSLEMTTKAGSGHPTSALSAADIVAALYFHIMQYDPNDPFNPNNDRFILSKGHAVPVVYAALKQLGILTYDECMNYRSFDSVLEGHPTARFIYNEAATGSLGQGLSIGLGMALTARLDARKFYIYVLLGDSECSEGSIWEAAELAAYYKVHNLIAYLDCNRLGQTGQTIEGWDCQDYAQKFAAFGWNTFIINGHNVHEILEASAQAKKITDKPSIIIAKTIKGYGLSTIENKNGFHGKAFSAKELPTLLHELQSRFAPYVQKPNYSFVPTIPKKDSYKEHEQESSPLKMPDYTTDQMVATRKAYGQALVALGKKSINVVSLDAEVKNSTFAELFEDQFPDRFFQCFIAEQNMVSMAVGMALRGKIPFVSTFGVFFTRAFDQIRMAAIGNAPLRLVGSHAGVSIGQDGPSQMALEDIAMMRTIMNSVVLYPCDAVSTSKLLEVMFNHTTGISYLRTTRAETPVIYPSGAQFVLGGCTVLRQSDRDILLLVAAGITLFEALKAYDKLKKEGILVAVIDLYSIKPLDASTLLKIARNSNNRIITIEDHYLEGGLGQAVQSALANANIETHCLAVKKMARSGKPEELLHYEEIDSEAIIKKVRAYL